MGARPIRPTLMTVSSQVKPHSGGRRRVIVVGGGVAGLETLIGLRTLAGDRVDLELISPAPRFAYRPLAVAAGVGRPPGSALELSALAESLGATFTCDTVRSIDSAENIVHLGSGEHRDYDFLVLAPGARAEESIPGAITFGMPRGIERFRQVIGAAERGHLQEIVFAMPAGCGWPVGLYELAMLTAQRLARTGVHPKITLVTPEAAPLALFGARASAAVLEELEELGIHFVPDLHPYELAWGELRARPGNVRIQADVVITLPHLSGPAIPGVPSDPDGFIPVSPIGLVRGHRDIYAAGDATALEVKYDAIAAEQADAVASAIAHHVGANVEVRPFRPLIRGVLLSAGRPGHLEGTLSGQTGEVGTSSPSPLWWPPATIAAQYLGPYLSEQVTGEPALPCGQSQAELGASLAGMAVELDLEDAVGV
jgi:sulfide:quinone oxidoreductase